MTLGTLRNSVAAKIGLDNTASSQDQTLIDQWANEGVVDVLLNTRCYVASATMALTSGQKDYELSTAILHIDGLTLTSGGSVYRMRQTTPAEILEFRIASGSAASVVPLYYAVNGSNLLMVHPTPTSADTITVYYTPRPTVMAAAADDPSTATFGGVPTEFHKGIELYALWQAADYDDDTTSKQGQDYRTEYELWLRRIRKHVNTKGSTVLAPAKIGRRPFIPRDPSTDTGI